MRNTIYTNSESFKKILNSIPIGVILVGLHGFILDCNRKAVEILDKNRKAVVGLNVLSVISAIEKKNFKSFISNSIRYPKNSSRTFSRLTKDKKKQHLEITSSKLYGKSGNEGLVLALRDVTTKILAKRNHKIMEKALEVSEKKFHSLFNNAMDSITMTDTNGNFVDVNPMTCELFGISKEEIIGKSIMEFLKKDSQEKMKKTWKKFIRLDRQKGEIKILCNNSFVKDIEFTVTANFFPGFNLYILRDITERKIEEKRQEYFLGIVGHELKTPLSSIKAFAQITQKKLLQGENKKPMIYLSRIDSQVDKLTKFVNEILDITRIKAGRLEISEEVFDFDNLIGEIISNIKQTVNGYNIIKRGKAGKNIIADKKRIEQVINNLIFNAIKYSPEKNKIIVNVLSDKNYISFSVKDFGIGIPREKQEKIFEPFYRAGTLKEEFSSGLGLGLHISSEIVRLHGGQIRVESTENKGSTFHVLLPVKRSKTKDPNFNKSEVMQNIINLK